MPKKRSSTKVRKGVTKGKKAKRASAPAQPPAVESTLSVLDGPIMPVKTYRIVVQKLCRAEFSLSAENAAEAFEKAEKLPDSLTWKDGEVEIAEVIENEAK